MAGLAVSIFYEVTGFTDCLNQFCNNCFAGLSFIAAIICYDLAAIVVAGFYFGYVAVRVIADGNFGIHAQAEDAAIC